MKPSPMYVFGNFFRELAQPRRLVPWFFVILVVTGFAALTYNMNPGKPADAAYSNTMQVFIYRLVAFVGAVITAAVVSAEVDQKTIVYLLTRPIHRAPLLLARTVAAALVTGIVGAGFVIAAAILYFKAGAFSQGVVWRDIGVVFLGAFAYNGVFLLISLLVNKALMYSLLFAFGWEAFLPNMPGNLYYASILSHMKGIAQHPGVATASPGTVNTALGTEPLVPLQTAWMVILVVPLVFYALSAWWFSTHEFVPRESAE